VPNAVGACTRISTRLIAPCPSTSESSILFAPATIPATTTDTLAATFAPADPATRSATTSCNPARSATASAGTRPATDTRFGSWKSAETLCETRIYRVPLSSRVGNCRKSHFHWPRGHPSATTHPPPRRIRAQWTGGSMTLGSPVP